MNEAPTVRFLPNIRRGIRIETGVAIVEWWEMGYATSISISIPKSSLQRGPPVNRGQDIFLSLVLAVALLGPVPPDHPTEGRSFTRSTRNTRIDFISSTGRAAVWSLLAFVTSTYIGFYQISAVHLTLPTLHRLVFV